MIYSFNIGDYVSIKKLKEKEKEERRNYIIDASEKLFFDKGYDNVSMKDIANKVGIDRTTIYLYFKNKEAIYFSIVLRAVKIMNEIFKESVKSDKNGIDKLRDTGWAYYEFNENFPDYHKIYVSFEYLRFQNNDKYDISEIMAVHAETVRIVCKAIAEGIEDGSIRKDLNPLQIAMYMATTSYPIVNPNPDILKALDMSAKQYYEDYLDLLRLSLMNTENKVKD